MPEVRLANGRSFSAADGAPILDAARQAGLTLGHGCGTGRCGICKARRLSGVTRALGRCEALSPAEQAAGMILTCRCAAVTDVALDVEDLGLPPHIVRKLVPCRIDRLERLAPDVMQIMLRLPPGVEFAYLPGQYLNVIGPGAHRRSYSIANAPSADKRIELHVRRVPGGILSEYWFERARANDLLRLDGPIGTFFHRGDPKETVFLVTGTGYAPAKAILEDLAARRWPHPVLLIWGGRDRHDHYHVPAGGGLDLSFEAVLSREPSPHARRGYVQDVLLATGRDPADMIVYACGSEKMIAAARAALVAAGLPLKSFHSDAFVQSSPESDNV